MLTVDDFLEWERASRDTLDFKRCYVDLTGDLVSGLLLSQIIFWFLPGDTGTRLRIEREGRLWLAKGRTDWWQECRISPKQFDRACKVLVDGRLIEVRRFKFRGHPTIHIWLNVAALVEGVNSILTKGVIGTSPKGEMQLPQRVNSLTKTTTKTTNIDNLQPVPVVAVQVTDKSAQPNIFKLYEENIGMLTPMIGEQLKEAEALYLAEWIEDAFKEAVSHNKRSWRYILAILERWGREGKDSGQREKPGKGEVDPEKYFKGRYGHLVRR